MRELSDAMNEAFEHRARAMDDLTPTAGELDGLRGRVRRRRVLRHSAEVAVVAPVVAAVVAGGFWLTADRSAPTPPVDTPTPSVVPSPEPTPTQTPEPGEDLGQPVLRPGFPSYYEIPDGMLEQAGPGWVVATIVPRTADVSASEHTEEGVFLIRPDGTRFLLHWLPTGLDLDGTTASWTQHDVVSFDAAAGTAVLNVRNHYDTYSGDFVGIEGSVGDGAGELVEMDLATGAVATISEPPERANELAGAVGDEWLWLPHPEGEATTMFLVGPDGVREIDTRGGAGGAVDISPTGRWVITGRASGGGEFEVVDLEAGESVGVAPQSAEGPCAPVQWWDADTVAATCTDGAGRVDLVTYEVSDLGAGPTVVRELELSDVATWGTARMGDGRIVAAGRASDEEATCQHDGVYLVDGEQSVPLVADPRMADAYYRATAVDGIVYVSAAGCSLEDQRAELVLAHDRASGSTVELVGSPVPNEAATTYATQTSYAVAQ